MHLSSITIKGFKSFPERTRLEFSPGVSVIVGPNGCGKSNITDAVLWALGEQSPLAVRGQTMQDMIFAGGDGESPRRYAEVEVVLASDHGIRPAGADAGADGENPSVGEGKGCLRGGAAGGLFRVFDPAPTGAERRRRVPAERRAVPPGRRDRGAGGREPRSTRCIR